MRTSNIDNTTQTAIYETKPMSILGREMKIPTTIEKEHTALRGCTFRFISSHAKGSLTLVPQHTVHSDHSYVLSLWLCSDKACPHAIDFRLWVLF